MNLNLRQAACLSIASTWRTDRRRARFLSHFWSKSTFIKKAFRNIPVMSRSHSECSGVILGAPGYSSWIFKKCHFRRVSRSSLGILRTQAALRVPPAVTRLTVYRRLHIYCLAPCLVCVLRLKLNDLHKTSHVMFYLYELEFAPSGVSI